VSARRAREARRQARRRGDRAQRSEHDRTDAASAAASAGSTEDAALRRLADEFRAEGWNFEGGDDVDVLRYLLRP
jgi:hypothetical protein